MERPGVGIGVIIMKESNKVLLGKRLGSHGAGTWSFPGGHLDFYESFKDCASRETLKETGLTKENIEVIDENPVAVTNDFFLADGKHYATLFIRAKYISGEPIRIEKDRCEKWKWFEWDKMPYPLCVSTVNLLEQNYNPFKK